jgi:hypothetical protein
MDGFFSKLTQCIDPSSFVELAQPADANRRFFGNLKNIIGNMFCSAQQLHRRMI